MKLKFYLSALFVVLSLFAYVYLTQDYYAVKYSGPTGDSICSVNSTFDCEAVAASSYSALLFNIPNAVLGLSLMIFMFISLIILLFKQTEKNSSWASFYLLLASVNLAASLLMAGIAFTSMDVYCLFCIALYVLSILIFATALLLQKDFGKINFSGFLKNKQQISLLLLVPLMGVVLHALIKNDYAPRKVKQEITAVIQSWENRTAHDFSSLAPIFTLNQGAPIKIVEFADFLCPHCATAHDTFKSFLKVKKDVEFSFYAYPLDPTCNPNFDPDIKGAGYSCTLAAGVYCAQKEDKGLELYNHIFTNQRDYSSVASKDKNEGLIEKMAQAIDLTRVEEWKSCINSQSTLDYLSLSARLGKKAQVLGTPTVYVNGKKLDGGSSYLILNEIHRVAQP